MVIPDEHEDHPTITRTQNLNVPTSEKTIIRDDDKVSYFKFPHTLISYTLIFGSKLRFQRPILLLNY